MHSKIDSCPMGHLPLCLEPGCGWRGGIELSKIAAVVALQRHQHQVHPSAANARAMSAKVAAYRRRSAGHS